MSMTLGLSRAALAACGLTLAATVAAGAQTLAQAPASSAGSPSAALDWSGNAAPPADGTPACDVLNYTIKLTGRDLALTITSASGRSYHAIAKLKDDGSFSTSYVDNNNDNDNGNFSLQVNVTGHINGNQGTLSVVTPAIIVRRKTFGGCAWRGVELTS